MELGFQNGYHMLVDIFGFFLIDWLPLTFGLMVTFLRKPFQYLASYDFIPVRFFLIAWLLLRKPFQHLVSYDRETASI